MKEGFDIKKNEELVIRELIAIINDCNIKMSELHLKFLKQHAKIYRAEIDFLENTKPLLFRKKAYSRNIEELEMKLSEVYKQINEEGIVLMKLKQGTD